MAACNEEAVRLFDLKSKDEFVERFGELSPEYQPDGRPSLKTAIAHVEKAFQEGYCRFEWMHNKLNGDPIPVEVTLIRAKYRDEHRVIGYFRDLTELKASAAKMREADERAQLMLEQTPLVVMLWDKDGNILDCNQEAVRVTGLSNRKEYSERLFELTPDLPNGIKSSEAAKIAIAQCIETGYVRIPWALHHAVTGELIPFDVTAVRAKYKGNDIVISYGQDMRERDAAIAKMREADERAKAMLETSPLASCILDKNGNVVDCNPEALKMFGVPTKEIFFQKYHELSPKHQPCGALSSERMSYYASVVLEMGYCRFEWMHQKADGTLLPCEITLVNVTLGGESAVTVYHKDLTEQKVKEELTKIVVERTSTLSAILDTAPDLIFCKDLNSRFTLVNKSFEELFGITKENIIGKDTVDGLNFSPAIGAVLAAKDENIYKNSEVEIYEDHIRDKDGALLVLETIKAPLIIDGTMVGLVGTSRDITQRREAARLQAEAEAANNAKSSFLATMSHEMRTPMNAILGITEIQLQREEMSPETKNALNIIYNSGYSLLAIVNDLLDLSKIEAGKLELVISQYETASLINDTINLNTARIGSKPIEFKLEVDPEMPSELIGDELRIKQILNNLLSNAFKYTPAGEVKLSLSAKPANLGALIGLDDDAAANTPRVMLTITVTDTGQGMTHEQVNSLFDAYSRFNLQANRFVEGTGLGMNIVQHLVQKMGGVITANSALGEGSEFTVHLTQGLAGTAKIGSEAAKNLSSFRLAGSSKIKKAQIVREHMPYGSVLVVDDMETNLYVARGFLLPYGLKIETAISGSDAIGKIERGDVYDIVFMDHMMPGMDGMEAVRIIREKGYKNPIVALTANAVSGQADVFMSNGFDGFISKPIDIRELNAALNRFVRDRQPPDVVEAARAAHGQAKTDTKKTPPEIDPELIRLFIRDAEKAIVVLQDCASRGYYEGDNLQLHTVNVHALKSALATIGETSLSTIAMELEMAGNEKNIAFITDKTPVFLHRLQAVIDKLRPDDGENDVSGEDTEQLRRMLQAVEDANAAYVDRQSRNKPQGGVPAIDSEITGEHNRVPFVIEGLNTKKGIRMTGGVRDSYIDTLSIFQKDGFEKIRTIKECLTNDDTALYTTHVHGLKSICASIGADHLSSSAEALEEAGKKGDIEFIKANSDKFLLSLELMLKNLGRAIEETKAAQRDKLGPVDIKVVKETLTSLKSAIERLDLRVTDRSMESLQGLTRGSEMDAAVANIYSKILMAEYEDAIPVIEKLLGELDMTLGDRTIKK
jgi:PAS domain S-box-containing protein